MSFALYVSVAIGVHFFCMFMSGVVGEDFTPKVICFIIAIALLWPLVLVVLAIVLAAYVVFYLPYQLGSNL